MLTTTTTPLLTLALLLPSALSIPTRTTCHCKIVSLTDSTNSAPSPLSTPSTAHWTPANPSSSSPPTPLSVCDSLASQLETFRHSDPELYNLYMRSGARPNDKDSLAQKPIPTSVLLANSKGGMHDYASSSSSPIDESSEEQRKSWESEKIVCYSVPSTGSSQAGGSSTLGDFHSSPLALCVLQVIVLFSVLACVIEGVNYIRKCFQPSSDDSSTTPQPIHLPGSERRLLAIPASTTMPSSPYDIYSCSSPGAEKKLRAYEQAPPHRHHVRREFIAYDDDSDDEVNRPVM